MTTTPDSSAARNSVDSIIEEFRDKSVHGLAIALADYGRWLERLYIAAQNANAYRQDALDAAGPESAPQVETPSASDLFAQLGKALASRQAQIDRLMLEYCPDEMTPEQIANWSAHQRPATKEETDAIDEASLPPATADTPRTRPQRHSFNADWAYTAALDAWTDEFEIMLSTYQAKLERECSDADHICTKLGLPIERARTEGGSLHVPRILNHIQETLDALTQATQFGATMSDKYAACQAELWAANEWEKQERQWKEQADENSRQTEMRIAAERKAREEAEQRAAEWAGMCGIKDAQIANLQQRAEAAESRLAELEKHAEAMAEAIRLHLWGTVDVRYQAYKQWKAKTGEAT